MKEKIFVGLDIGSRTSKIIAFQEKKIIFSDQKYTGVKPDRTAIELKEKMCEKLKIVESDIARIITTGYGRNIVKFSQNKISEISCHARGVNYFFPEARTVIDIGGQDSKVIILDKKGKVKDFMMNDRCAAGTGKFLEVAANTLETSVTELGELAAISKNNIKINSTCVVFAESEMIGLIAEGVQKADIVKAVHFSIARRIKNMVARLNWKEPVIFTGGVAKNSGMKKALIETLGCGVNIPSDPFITGALGAAIFAYEKN